MANTDKAEEGTSELLHDGLGAVTDPASGDVSLHESPHPPVVNTEQPYAIISSHSTTPEQVPAASASVPSASYSPFAIPHPKRFSAVNINKKFLQKNTASSTAATIPASHATAAKAGSPAPRPPTQPTSSHSKLVTAKLTSIAQLATTTGPGWSRPSSATPPVSTTPSSSSNVPQPQSLAPPPAAPQLPHAGRVIQPQPRNAISSSFPLVKSTPKPAWGNPKTVTTTSLTDNASRSDFPTAAEVAQGCVAKHEESKSEDLTAGQVPPQEADAFRGVHLDPNAHHWDEMEEDDDNFLDNIIEFGDGRQYKVAPPPGQLLAGGTTTPPIGGDASAPVVDHFPIDHVPKAERFTDDFDRSWPRAAQSPLVLQRDLPSRSSQHTSVSPTSSQPSHSSVEGSRVLFNERSNRLEPYTSSNFPNRLGPTFGFSRRAAHGEPSLSPTESRSSRDAPPHSPAHPVHLLQKSPAVVHDSVGQSSRIYDGRRNMERDAAPHLSGGYYGQNKTRAKDGAPWAALESRGTGEKRPRRSSGASFASSSIQDSQPHGSPNSPGALATRRIRPRESPVQPSCAIPIDASSPVSRAPQLSGASQLSTPDLLLSSTSSVLDIEGVHKTTMHISAERAKQRRQLEEEEREKEKERARKKAAELEARMKKAQEVAAVETIQDAVNSTLSDIQPAPDSEEQKPSPAAPPNGDEPPPSLKPVPRAHRNNQVSQDTPILTDEILGSADQADSWRSKTRFQSSQAPMPVPPILMFQDNEEPAGAAADENLEVVDFSELGKFVGSEQTVSSNATTPPPRTSSSPERTTPPARLVASDFFDDDPPHSSVQKVVTSSPSEQSALPPTPVPDASVPVFTPRNQVPALLISTAQETKERESYRFSATSPVARGHASATTPHYRVGAKGPGPFRQVTMSALDDVMSRIKGALDDMQVDAGRGEQNWRASMAGSKVRGMESSTSARTLSKETKWLPPALRRTAAARDPEQEIFDVTGCDPPHSPRLNTPVVKMPPTSRPVEIIPKRQLHLLKNASSHVRFDILSWDPPVDGMSRRDLSVIDILFKRPPLTKGNKLRCRVQLPRFPHPPPASLPKVNLPSSFPKPNAVSGRSRVVDDLPTWRRGLVASSNIQKTPIVEETIPVLDVTSCSPPPELPAGPLKPAAASDSTKLEPYWVRPRTQPRLPAGSSVGFYRDPGSLGQDSKKTAVNFTVSSELEAVPHPSSPKRSMLLPSSTTEASLPTTISESKEITKVTHVADEVNQVVHPPTLGLITQVDSKVPEESTERSLRTPASASFSTPWTKSPLSFSSKDSPARAPDPEHLRAVWSQATDKERVSAVNSLEGIADDLTALPFTIQEVKSEDGETPPPTGTGMPSKISLHDVTRAFQQVPTSSTVTPHRPLPISPSTANGPIIRPPNFNYPTPLQAPAAGMRPHFAAFSSPMLAHSPSPTMLYPPSAPSPIPRVPMNQLYNQTMWVPMQTSQNNGTVQPVSPYPAQMVAYPAPTPVHPVYASGLSPQNIPPGVSGPAPPRPRGMTVISPVLHHAAPANMSMYNGSPVLMHPPAMIAPGHRPPYMSSGPSERVNGQGRLDAPHMQQPSHSQNHLPPQPAYTHVPPFSRPSW